MSIYLIITSMFNFLIWSNEDFHLVVSTTSGTYLELRRNYYIGWHMHIPRPAICHHICALFQHCFNSLARTMDQLYCYPNICKDVAMGFWYARNFYWSPYRLFNRTEKLFEFSSFSSRCWRSEYQQVLDYCFPSAHPRHSRTAARGHTLFTDTYLPKGEHTCPERIGTSRSAREIPLWDEYCRSDNE